MSLEIGDATLTGLKHVQKLGGAAKQLIQAAFQTAVHGATEGAQPQQGASRLHHRAAGNGPSELFLTSQLSLFPGTVAYKEAFASCMTLIFEAARHDAAVTDVQ
jgi:hypothetical protein